MIFSRSKLRTPQAVNCPTFKPPPQEHALSIPELYRYHAWNSARHPVFAYSDPDTNISRTIVYPQAWQSICAAARIGQKNFTPAAPRYAQQTRTKNQRPVVAILASADTLSYMYLIIGLMSIGCAAFPLSLRNGAAATAALLQETGALQIYVSSDPSTSALAKESAKLLARKGIELDVLPMVTFDALNSLDGTYEDLRLAGAQDDEVMLILHSSGTTAFPKPIKFSKRGIFTLTNIPCYGEIDWAGKRIAGHTNPPFHSMGLVTYIWPLSCGAVFCVYPPKPTIPTPANLINSLTADICNFVICVPAFLEAWAQNPEDIERLKPLDAIIFTGASIAKSVGNKLARAGVKIHAAYASTEVGPASMFVPRDRPPEGDWDYFRFSNHVNYVMQPQINMPGVFEPIIIPTETCSPRIVNTMYNGLAAYAAGDLLEQHPQDSTRWRVYAREEHIIMLTSGENVNPVPMENTISLDNHVASAIMFGNNRFHTGLLVEPASGIKIFPVDDCAVEKFIDLIWPTVERANSSAEAYARIAKHMIIVTSPDKPLEYTLRGVPRRLTALRLYADEIDALYRAESAPAGV